MFSKSAFRAIRTPAVPEAFPESAAARRKQKEAPEEKEKEEEKEGEGEEGEILPSPPSGVTSEASRPLSPVAKTLRPRVQSLNMIVRSAAARRKQKEAPEEKEGEGEGEEGEILPSPPSGVTSDASRPLSPVAKTLRPQFQSLDMIVRGPSPPITEIARSDPLSVLAEEPTRNARRTKFLDRPLALRRHRTEVHEDLSTKEESSISAGENGDVDMVSNSAVEEGIDSHRETLCIKWGLRVWDDLTEVTIYPALLIEHYDEAMIVRVKDLLGPGLFGDDVVLGEPFIAEHDHNMGMVDDKTLCAILVTASGYHGKVRVGDFNNLKPQTEKYPIGYAELDSANLSGPHIMIVKLGQIAVVEGRPELRLFVRVPPGFAGGDAAKVAARVAWIRRRIYAKRPVWHDYFTKKRRCVSGYIWENAPVR